MNLTSSVDVVRDLDGAQASRVDVSRYIMLRFPVFTVPTDSPVPAMLLLGSSYAVFTAAIWPSMYLEVNEEHRASAFAFASAGKNVSHVPCA